jgi:hypothetical protein
MRAVVFAVGFAASAISGLLSPPAAAQSPPPSPASEAGLRAGLQIGGGNGQTKFFEPFGSFGVDTSGVVGGGYVESTCSERLYR